VPRKGQGAPRKPVRRSRRSEAKQSLHNEYKEMMRRRDLWTDEMRELHARRKEAVDDCLLALADLDDVERSIVKDRLRDLFDLEDGLLHPSDVTPW
jgi:hypothetical protein